MIQNIQIAGQPMKEQVTSKSERFAENIRKDHREEVFGKRRNIQSSKSQQTHQQTTSKINIVDMRFQDKIRQFNALTFKDADITKLVACIISEDVVEQHHGIIGIRKLLTKTISPPIQVVIDAGLVPRFIKYAQQTQYLQLQLEATWCLTNIAAGNQNQCNSIIEKGGIKIFVDLLLSPTIGVVEQAIWALGNIACDSPHHRDSILKCGGLKNLLIVMRIAREQYQTNKNMIETISSIAWSLANLCRMKPIPEYSAVEKALDLFAELLSLKIINDTGILGNICWSISYFCSNNEKKSKVDKVQKCIERGIGPIMFQYIRLGVDSITLPCIRTIGNLTTGTDEQVQYMLSLNLLQVFEPLLNGIKSIRKDVCWTLANIGAGNQSQVTRLLQRQNLIKNVLNKFESDSVEIKSQIVFIFSNMVENADPNMLFNFFKEVNIMKYYAAILYEKSSTVLLQNNLEGMYFILELGEKFKTYDKNPFVLDLEGLGAIDQMQSLQSHTSINVSNKMLKILSTFFQIADPFDF